MKHALTVDEALARILSGAEPTPSEDVSLLEAAGRTLAESPAARLTQPPFNASAMDGYAVRKKDVADLPATLAALATLAKARRCRARDAGQEMPARPAHKGALQCWPTKQFFNNARTSLLFNAETLQLAMLKGGRFAHRLRRSMLLSQYSHTMKSESAFAPKRL